MPQTDSDLHELTGIRIRGANRLLLCVVVIERASAPEAVSAIVLDNGHAGSGPELSLLGE